jgi:hypothetical protein
MFSDIWRGSKAWPWIRTVIHNKLQINLVTEDSNVMYVFVRFCCYSPHWAMAASFTSFIDHTQRGTTVGRTPLHEWSPRRRDLYPTIQNTHNWPTSMPPVGFEPTISAGERLQTYTLDRAATGNGKCTVFTAPNTINMLNYFQYVFTKCALV